MPDKKISALDAIVSVDDADVLPIVDTSVTTTKKINVSQIKALAPVQSVASKTGAVTLVKGDVGLGNVDNTADADKPVSSATQTALNAKQDTLVSGTNIKTINDESILGSGNITISGGGGISDGDKGDITVSASGATWTIDNGVVTDAKIASGIDAVKIADGSVSNAEYQYLGGVTSDIQTQLDGKEATLVSGTNIKTINSTSLLGSGDIVIGGGSPSGVSGAIQFSDGSAFASDASNLFWDDTNNRLGIGTNAPTSALEVASDAKINGLTVGLGGGAASGCTAFGESALLDNLTGTNNTAIGKSSLENNTASNNTAVGFEAALTNTTSTGITAIGYQALRLSTGANNTAIGFQSADSTTTGAQNTAIGSQTLETNTIGNNNVAIGYQALKLNVSGSNNMALGTQSLFLNTGNANTSIGTETMFYNTTGRENVAVGFRAMQNNSTGIKNTALGYNTQSGNFNGSTIIGLDAVATASNQFVVGSATTNAGAVTTETITADTTWTVRINGANYKIPMLAI